jgi:hypothetical protein
VCLEALSFREPADPTRAEPESYEFVIAPSWSDDGGFTWHEVDLQRQADWPNSTDPALAWDKQGNAYLLVLPLGPAPNLDFKGVAVYRSIDGGKSWSSPNQIHVGNNDDKDWATTDATSGRTYAAWDDGSSLGFARTVGTQWKGAGAPAGAAGSHIPGVTDSFSPTLTVTLTVSDAPVQCLTFPKTVSSRANLTGTAGSLRQVSRPALACSRCRRCRAGRCSRLLPIRFSTRREG